jgi:hypothetical protein
MLHRDVLIYLNKLLKDIAPRDGSEKKPFGGKCVILGGESHVSGEVAKICLYTHFYKNKKMCVHKKYVCTHKSFCICILQTNFVL